MKSNKSITFFIITICFSINGLFSESTKNLNLKDVDKIKQYVQNIQSTGYFIGHSDVYSNECHEFGNENDCNMHDHCWWDDATGESGECIQDDGPPECLKTCGQGFEALNEESTEEEFCAVLTSADTTGCGCSDDELSDIGCFSYMCGGLEYIDEDNYFDELTPNPNCMAGCLTTGCDFGGDTCELVACLSTSGCMTNCTPEEILPFDGMTYFCNAPEDCEEFFDMDDDPGDDDEMSVDSIKLLPEQFLLHSVYPNPFNPTTDIGFSLEYAGPVSIFVYDIIGRRIETILHNEFQNAGSHIVSWNGSQYPSGIYFIHLQADRQVDIQKVTLLK